MCADDLREDGERCRNEFNQVDKQWQNQSNVTLTSTYNEKGNSVRAKMQKVTSGCVRESANE